MSAVVTDHPAMEYIQRATQDAMADAADAAAAAALAALPLPAAAIKGKMAVCAYRCSALFRLKVCSTYVPLVYAFTCLLSCRRQLSRHQVLTLAMCTLLVAACVVCPALVRTLEASGRGSNTTLDVRSRERSSKLSKLCSHRRVNVAPLPIQVSMPLRSQRSPAASLLQCHHLQARSCVSHGRMSGSCDCSTRRMRDAWLRSLSSN